MAWNNIWLAGFSPLSRAGYAAVKNIYLSKCIAGCLPLYSSALDTSTEIVEETP